MPEAVVRGVRHALGVRPVYKTVDTCAAEFAAHDAVPLLAPTTRRPRSQPRERPAVLILGVGPNRIGQGVEFDYSCVHATFALRDAGYDTVMVNCNPETVSTDYDTSSRLYFEPLTLEDVLEVVPRRAAGRPDRRGHRPARRPDPARAGQGAQGRRAFPIVGTSRRRPSTSPRTAAPSGACSPRPGLPAPKHGTAYSAAEAVEVAREIGYPVLVRPSYVLGGRGMEIVYDDDTLAGYVTRATDRQPRSTRSSSTGSSTTPSRSTSTRSTTATEMYLGGIMEHIEEAGIHSGDSACTLPPVTLGDAELERVREATLKLAEGIGVRGLMNVQFALAQDVLYVLEANPRASRTVPFVAKATGVPIAKAAARVMLGATIKELRAEGLLPPVGDGGTMPSHAPVAVKEAVLPFKRFRTRDGQVVDSLLGPEMRSTGEVMGIDHDFGTAFAKGQLAAVRRPAHARAGSSCRWPTATSGAMIFPVKRLADLGFTIVATTGTAEVLRRNGITAQVVRKAPSAAIRRDGDEPSIVDLILSRRDRHGGQHAVRPERPGRRLRHPRGHHLDGQADHHHRPGAGVPPSRASRRRCMASSRVKPLQEHARDLDLYGRGVRA